jgi:N-acyl amino acid synthase of PEP-CTERM/exosortase system
MASSSTLPARPDAGARRDDARPGVTGAEGPSGLLDIYNSYFEAVAAETAAQREQAFRLRYEVYCVEHPYEDPAENPGGLETDRYDPFSVHSILIHKPSQEVVGTVRLILPQAGETGPGMPIRDVCQHDLIVHDNPELPRAKTAEISRFSVSKQFRRRAQDEVTSVGSFFAPEDDPRRHIPNLSLGLMQAIVAMAAQNGVTHLYAVLEPTLLRMLRPLGIHFVNLGPPVMYHGRRQPCFSALDAQLARLWAERPDVWALVTRTGSLWPLNRTLGESHRRSAALAKRTDAGN